MKIISVSVILIVMVGGWFLDFLGFRRFVLGGVLLLMVYR